MSSCSDRDLKNLKNLELKKQINCSISEFTEKQFIIFNESVMITSNEKYFCPLKCEDLLDSQLMSNL